MRRGPAVAAPAEEDSRVAAVQPLLERVAVSGQVEQRWIGRAWDLYETPEVRFAARQYANAFASAKLMLGRRKVLWEDPEPILEPASPAEQKALELLLDFAGGPVGQVELLDRMGIYFTITGDMVLVGAYDPARQADDKFAKWDIWSTTEVRWTGRSLTVRTSELEDVWSTMPPYIKHVRLWNRHPRRGWESDSPVRAALDVLELIRLYDNRLSAEALSRLVGAGVWMIPQGMRLPTSTNDPAGGTPEDFLRLLMDVAKAAMEDKRGPAATVPVLLEAAAEDIEAASKGRMTFWSEFDEHVKELQTAAIKRWATGVDLPAEAMLGLSQATHWNASLISEDKVQSFVVPSLRRAVGNLTVGWLRPALAQFGLRDDGIELWFDPSGIKTRVDTADESQWAYDENLISAEAALYANGLHQAKRPDDEEIKRQLLLNMAKQLPASTPDVLKELGIPTGVPGILQTAHANGAQPPAQPSQGGAPIPRPPVAPSKSPGRAAELGTTRGGG